MGARQRERQKYYVPWHVTPPFIAILLFSFSLFHVSVFFSFFCVVFPTVSSSYFLPCPCVHCVLVSIYVPLCFCTLLLCRPLLSSPGPFSSDPLCVLCWCHCMFSFSVFGLYYLSLCHLFPTFVKPHGLSLTIVFPLTLCQFFYVCLLKVDFTLAFSISKFLTYVRGCGWEWVCVLYTPVSYNFTGVSGNIVVLKRWVY